MSCTQEDTTVTNSLDGGQQVDKLPNQSNGNQRINPN